MSSRGCVLRLFLCLALVAANAGSAAREPQGQPRLRTALLSIETADGRAVEVAAELAVTESERAAGLMHRTSLPDGEGMLFVFERDQILSFWMQNTVIPLSIAFVSRGGLITEIRDMRPLDLTPVVSARPGRYALEVPQGWFEREGVAVGDRIRLDF